MAAFCQLQCSILPDGQSPVWAVSEAIGRPGGHGETHIFLFVFSE